MEIKKYVSLPYDLYRVVKELPKQHIFSCVNKNTLGTEYFGLAQKHLNEPFIYIVLADTGSPFSNILSLTTGKKFNHASLSFDENLETLVSYNGGNGIHFPGLNREKVEHLMQKEDAKIAVYRIMAMPEQKRKILDEIMQIDEEGSSYNLTRVIMKKSFAPNIKVCSQFVYEMLSLAGLQYFDKNPIEVIPMDFLDHKTNQLQFCYEKFVADILKEQIDV